MGGFYNPLYLAVTCSIWFLPEEFSTWLFWEMTSGYVVFSSALLGSTVDARSASVNEFFWGIVSVYSAAQCLVLSGTCYASVTEFVVDFPVVVQRPIPMVLTVCRTTEIPLLLDKVIDVPVVQVAQLPGGPDVQKTVVFNSCSPRTRLTSALL